MIDKEAAADAGARMNLDAGDRARELGNHPGHGKPSGVVKPVCHSMQQHRVKTGIAQDDLQHAARGRIAAEDGIDLFPDRPEHPIHYRVKTRIVLCLERAS